jgi:DNA-binding NtrC family response regulator
MKDQRRLNILILDDEPRLRGELSEFLLNNGFGVFSEGVPSDALELFKHQIIDILILDIKLPEMDGLEVLRRVKKEYPETEVIMISGHGDMNDVIEAIRYGAVDYFTKPFRLAEVQSAIERTQRYIALQQKVEELRQGFSLVSAELQSRLGQAIVGESHAMKVVVDLMRKVASTDDTSVLITGESGTGKEIVARGIHHLSQRREHYFHSVNCSAIPRELFESEFFGHTKGAFTGASDARSGWFEIADKGSLFLDEIVDMDPGLQSKFLRVLESKRVTRVGSTREMDFNVRIIAATNQNIHQMVKDGKFRIDLYHRLNIFHINIPPLRERREDIPLLFDHFLRLIKEKSGRTVQSVDERIYDILMRYDYPGNVRELRNIAERAIILAGSSRILAEHIILPMSTPRTDLEDVGSPNDTFDLEVMEKRLIMKALRQSGNNKSRAARLLNISWQALDRKLHKHHIQLNSQDSQ